jgi:hypothetical protein
VLVAARRVGGWPARSLRPVVVSHRHSDGATLARVPTTHPRYTVTDTGDVREMLDLAERRWPDVADRRALLLRLAAAGRAAIAPEVDAGERERRRRRQRDALGRAGELVDTDALLADVAWR